MYIYIYIYTYVLLGATQLDPAPSSCMKPI